MSETSSREQAQRDNRDNAMSVAGISSTRTETDENLWTRRLVLFLRVMAGLSLAAQASFISAAEYAARVDTAS